MRHPFTPSSLATFAVVVSVATAHAGILSYSTTAPTPGASDISNFTGTTTDGGNVSGGNDAATYLAFDRGPVGQTFTTGANARGYTLTALTLQSVTYGTTYATTTLASTLTFRVSTFSGTTLSPLASDTATVTGSEANQPQNDDHTGAGTTGNGSFLTLTFATPVTLMPNTTYAFDVAAGNNYFFETNGTSTNAYAGGQAYNANTTGGTAMTFATGDHVFDLALTAVPEPSTWAGVLTLAGAGLLAWRRRRTLAR